MNQDILFLKELQNELKTQETDGQAAPRYWSIMDYKWEPTSEDLAERVMLYDSVICETIDINAYADEIIDFEGERHLEFGKEQRDELKDIRDYESPSEICGWIEENDDDSRYYPVYEQEILFIAYNSCFLTKQEAKDHLKANSHHYTDKAHTFAMTAWRAPKMERLINILETFDWDQLINKDRVE